MGAFAGLRRADVLGILTAVADGEPVDLGWLDGVEPTARGLAGLEALTAIIAISGDLRRRTVRPASSFNQERARIQCPTSPLHPKTRQRP